MLPPVAKMLFRLPEAAAVTENPDPEQLKELASRMPNARPTCFGNLNAQTKVVNRSKRSPARRASAGPSGRPSTSPTRRWS